MNLTVNNPPKALIVLVALICISVLMAIGSIDSVTGMPIITMIVGYGIGNGIAAKQGQPVEPLIRAKNRRRSDRVNWPAPALVPAPEDDEEGKR